MKKVFVAMSGGVDSAVAAALLKQQNYDVTGVFIKIDIGPACDWREERREAMRAAAALKLPFLIFDLSAAYERTVIDYLVREYRAGRTPNPDVMCNRQIKFGAFFTEARRGGAELIATGHYARKQLSAFSFQLLASADREKDQTYFLWPIKQEILAKCLFPIGDYQKTEVRRLAKKFNLPNAAKPDSQGLCFVGQIDFKDFLAARLPEKTGQVLNEAEEVIGEHRGAHFYTIGERHGFTIKHRTALEPVYYVVAKDMIKNTITVASELKSWAVKEINLAETNWIVEPPTAEKIYGARIRYRAPLTPCHFVPSNGDRWHLVLSKPQGSVAPGQSCVIYDKNICLGGGVICS